MCVRWFHVGPEPWLRSEFTPLIRLCVSRPACVSARRRLMSSQSPDSVSCCTSLDVITLSHAFKEQLM